MRGDIAVAKILKAEGLDWISCFPNQTLIDAASSVGIRPIICRQERAGVNMADGYSRITNGKKIGVFTMQRGPGAENAFGGVAQAYADSVPILLIPGGSPNNQIGIHPNFDSFEHYGGITKWLGHINQGNRIPEMMRNAYTNLKHGRLGPVMLELPLDVANGDVSEESMQYQAVKVHKSAASEDDVRELVTAILASNSPVIHAGQGVLYAEATDALTEFAEFTNIPVMTTLNGKSAFPEDHPLALGTGGNSETKMVGHFISKADLIVGIGSSLTDSTFATSLPNGITYAQSVNCAEDLNKNHSVSFGAIGDARIVLIQMLEEAKRQLGENGRDDSNGVRQEIQKVKQEFLDEWSHRINSDETPINPYRVMKELSGSLDLRNSIVTHDSGYPRDQFAPFSPALEPRSYIGWGKSTQLGYGLGLAIGAKIAAPDKQVVNVMGDAAFGMSGLDIETAVRAEIPILTVVLNNGVMTNYSHHMPIATEQWESNALGGDYRDVALALGAYAERVESADEINLAVDRALKANNEGQPALLEIMVKEEPFSPKYYSGDKY